MCSQVVALAFLAVASAASLGPDATAPILKQDMDVSYDGSYHSSWESGNGISMEEHGSLKNLGTKDAEAEEVIGSVSYTAPDGTPISFKYIANENGFVAEGAHLPVPPQTPPAILRALEWNAAHPEPQLLVKKL